MVCCVTGHRPKGVPFPLDDNDLPYLEYFNSLSKEVEKLMDEGYTHFISGMADGADLDFAFHVIYQGYFRKGITLEAALPYPIKAPKKAAEYSRERDRLLLDCDIKTIVSPYYHKGCMQKRNRYMVDKSDIVLAVWNGSYSGGTWDTIKYARSKGKQIKYIMLNEIGVY